MAPSNSPLAPVIRVRLFARYAELLGADQIDLPAAGLDTAADVVARIRLMPGGESLGETALVAINLKQARPDAAVRPGDEVAMLPPLAGG